MNDALRTTLLQRAEEVSHNDDPSHDFNHILRVLKNAETIAAAEGADLDILLPAALFHDVINPPKSDPRAAHAADDSAEWTADYLKTLPDYPQEKIPAVCDAIAKCSFRKGEIPELLESKIMQDADRLEATGAVAIMRTFASCGTLKTTFYHPDDPFHEKREIDPSVFSSHGVDLFYRRLLLVEDRMHTDIAKRIAHRRTKLLHAFLDELKQELDESK